MNQTAHIIATIHLKKALEQCETAINSCGVLCGNKLLIAKATDYFDGQIDVYKDAIMQINALIASLTIDVASQEAECYTSTTKAT